MRVNNEYLEKHVKQKDSGPHIVYAGAEDDMYRQHLMPVMEQVIESTGGKMTLVEIDSYDEDVREFCSVNQVLQIPTIFFFRGGDLKTTVAGFVPIDILTKVAKDACEPTTAEKMASMIREAKERVDGQDQV